MLLFLFATDHRHIFCSSWSQGISQKSCKQICIACWKSVFWQIFSRIVGAWYWKSVILSRAPRICQHEDFWPIRAWYQSLVSRNGGIKACLQAPPPFPPAQATARLASLTDIFPFWPCALFPQCGAWSQARLLNTGSLKIFTGRGLISIIDIIYAILIFIYAYLCLFIIQKHFMQGKNRIINTLPSNQYFKQSSLPSCNLMAV